MRLIIFSIVNEPQDNSYSCASGTPTSPGTRKFWQTAYFLSLLPAVENHGCPNSLEARSQDTG